MKNMKMMAAGMCLLTVVSCQTKQGTGTLIGGGAGAALGGIVGQIIGHNGKSTAIGAAIGGAIGSGAGALIGRHMDKVARETAQTLPNARVDKVTDANGLECVKVTFDSGILFPLNGSKLSASAKNDLTKFAALMKRNSNCDVAIQGYTDASGNDNINLPLSQRRAEAVSSYLKIRSVQGFGSSNPIENRTISQANRRVEVYLYASSEMVRQANNGTL